MHRRIVPDVISGSQELATASGNMTVREACVTMAKRRIGALMIVEGGHLAGIFTERDVMTKIVGQHRDPDKVTLGEAMTRNPDTIGPDAPPREALSSAVLAEVFGLDGALIGTEAGLVLAARRRA